MSKQREQRALRFDTLDAAVADAEQLSKVQVRTTGSYSFGQILEHLARSFDMVTGTVDAPKMTLPLRIIVTLAKPYLLSNRPITAGFKLPKRSQDFLWPAGDVDTQQALDHFKAAIARYQNDGPLPIHPVFGKITREKNDQLNRRHCALHLSFVHPVS